MANFPTLRFSRLFPLLQVRFSSTKDSMSSEIDDLLIRKFATPDEGPDAPIVLEKGSPYVKSQEKCILCKHSELFDWINNMINRINSLDIKIDYKNTRLLQQFVSSFSGRVYEQHITGLCTLQYKQLLRAIKYSRKAGYMPILTKEPKFLRDPKLFDPMHPKRQHSYDSF